MELKTHSNMNENQPWMNMANTEIFKGCVRSRRYKKREQSKVETRKQLKVHCSGEISHGNCQYLHGPFRGTTQLEAPTRYPEAHALSYVVKNIDMSAYKGGKVRVTFRMYAFNNWEHYCELNGDRVLMHDHKQYRKDNPSHRAYLSKS